jgi:hypothetical protein
LVSERYDLRGRMSTENTGVKITVGVFLSSFKKYTTDGFSKFDKGSACTNNEII